MSEYSSLVIRKQSKRRLVAFFIVTGIGLLFLSFLIPAKNAKSLTATTAVAEFFAEFPMNFQVNNGSFQNSVKYFSKGYQYDLLFSQGEVLLNIYSNKNKDSSGNIDTTSQVAIQFVDYNGKTEILGYRPSMNEASVNKVNGESQSNYLEVKYQGVYPGIDVLFYGEQKQLFYEFELTEHASTSEVKMKIISAGDESTINVDIHGNVEITCEDKKMTINKPTVYRVIDNVKRPVSGYFFVTRQNEIRFKEVGDV